MKSFCCMLIFVLISAHVFGDSLPLFKMPPNNKYKLFNYSPTIEESQTKAQRIEKAPEPNFKVLGVFISGGQRIVLIGYNIYKEGDKVGDYTIKKIEDNKVIFLKGSREIVKTVSEEPNLTVVIDNKSKTNHP